MNVNDTNPNGANSVNIELKQLKEKLVHNELTIKQLAQMVRKKDLELAALKEELSNKEKECASYIEKIKSLEKKTDEVYKNVSNSNIQDLNEIKKQFDKEKLLLNEMIKTYKNGLEEKTEATKKLNEDLDYTRNLLDEERKKSESTLNILNSKFDQKSLEIQFHKVSSTNSNLRTKLMATEEKVEILTGELERLRESKKETEENLRNTINLMKIELSHKDNSYKTLLKDYQDASSLIFTTQENFEKANFFNKQYEKDMAQLEAKLAKLDKDFINVTAENEGYRIKVKGNEIELESLKKKVKEYEEKLAQIKLSKQVFEVTYVYMRMSIPGNFIMQNEENRSSTRKYSFLDVELKKDAQDNNKIIVNFLKENSTEEYFSNDTSKIMQVFEEFKKRVIEITDFSSSGKMEKVVAQKKAKIAEEKLKNLFEF